MSSEEDIIELLTSGGLLEKPIKHYTQVITLTLHHFYIVGEIEPEVDKYLDMINIIKTAEEHDKIFLHLNTPGGTLSTTIHIISAINQSAAEITTVIEGEVCSAGTFIFLAGHNYVVNDNCYFMIHNYSHEIVGKAAEVAVGVKFADGYYKSLTETFYKGFLTKKEMKQILEDKDFWMGSEEVIRRLVSRGIGTVNGDDIEDLEKLYKENKIRPKKSVKKSVKKTTKKSVKK